MWTNLLLGTGALVLLGSFAWTIYYVIDVLVLSRVYLDVHNELDGRDYVKKVSPKDGGYMWTKGLDKPCFIDLHDSKSTSYKGRPRYRAIVPTGDVYKPDSRADGHVSIIDGIIRARALMSTAAQKVAHSSGDDSDKWRALIWVGGFMAAALTGMAFMLFKIIQSGGITGA